MKSEKKKRLLAVVLCMVIVLSNSSFISASAETEQPAAVSEETVQQDVQEAGESAAGAADTPALLSETAPEETPEATSETTQTPEVTTEPTQASEETPEATQVPEMTETPETTSGGTVDQTQEAAAESAQEPTSTPDSETTEASETEETQAPTETTLKSNEAVELKQEFQDENGNVTATVTAQIPAGAFQADASELTMEVTVPDQAATENVKKLMEESLPEHYMLGDTILYDIRFKVNGTETESQQPIVITFENQDGIEIKDVKKAVVFQLDPADPSVEGDKDELVTITQRNDMIEYLQNSGQSTDNVDDYDLSEITLKEDGTSDKIQMEGRTSTIYGCYAYYEPVQSLTYEDDQVTVTVSAEEKGIIPANAELKVVPITEGKETEDQYKDVEKKLQEKAEEEEYAIAGFLAYDITFVDQDGNETEPKGEVKVSIDYKEAAIPESVSEEDAQNAEVTVLHLEENEKGEVKEVVDMAQNEKVDVLATTEENKVEKVEVRTESFSHYVVQWTKKDDTYPISISVYYGYLNNDDKFIEFEEYTGTKFPVWSEKFPNSDYDGGNITLKDYADDVEENNTSYKFYKGYVTAGEQSADSYNENISKYEAKYVSVNDNFPEHSGRYCFGYQGTSGAWKSLGELSKEETNHFTIYLTYVEEFETVNTLDNTEHGITMTMKDLDNADQTKLLGTWRSQYSSNGALYYNVEQGIVENILENGYPVAISNPNHNNRTGGNLAPLFANGTEVNHLFLESEYEETGYYEYSSFKNYAYLGDGTNFTVYNALGTSSEQNYLFYKRGNFLPYNSITFGNFSNNRNLYDEDGNELSEDDPNYNARLYKPDGAVNYHFSMTMKADFYQPENGMVSFKGEESPMIYEFNGDDDLWLYIDNVLILDIGGIHDAHSGTINFQTGEIEIQLGTDGNGKIPPYKTTIKELYEEAGVFPDGETWDPEKIDEYFTGNTFKDYTRHEMKMFYMERGEGASNLHIRFNLATIPDGSVTVEKKLGDTDKEKYANADFAFELYVQEKDDNWSEDYPVYKDNYVKVTKDKLEELGITAEFDAGSNVNQKDLCWDENGDKFYLKADQTVVFSGLKETQKYYVVEVGVNDDYYDHIKINETVVTEQDGDDNTEDTIYTDENGIQNITTSIKEVYDRPVVVFTNVCTGNNLRELRITKKMTEEQTSDDAFTFYVELSDQSGTEMIPYEGDYYLKKGETYYYYNNEGKLVEHGNEAIVCGSTEDGKLPDVKVGYTVIITKILSGTKYWVKEIDPNEGLSEEKYDVPVYTSDDTDAVTDDEKTYTSGSIELGDNVNITVTNTLLNEQDKPMIKVQKTFSGLTEDEIETLSNFEIIVKDQNQPKVATLKLSEGDCVSEKEGVSIQGPTKSGTGTEITYTWWIKNVDAGTYHVTENGEEKDGYTVTTTVNGSNYSDNIGVTTQEPTFTRQEIGRITEQSSTKYKFENIDVENIDVIVISLTDTETTEYIVWSEDTLSAGERKGLQKAISEAGNGQFGDSNFGTSDKIVFFSTREIIEKGFYYRGEISVDDDGNLVFEGGKHQWNMIWLGTYERTGTIDAEIELVNTYQAADMDVDLEKYGTGWRQQIAGATFELVSGVKGETEVTWNEDTKKSIAVDDTKNSVVELTELKSGYYMLKEIQAPVGYSLLNEDIYFVVNAADKTVHLTDVNGNILDEQEQAFFRMSDNKIQVMNEALYDLPSAGGSGIFWYLISGTAFMMAASLILYRMKRKEVLGK